MRRRTPLRRTGGLRRGGRLAPQSVRMRTEIEPRWRRVKAEVRRRAGGRCEVVLDGVRCPLRMDDPDHTEARWKGRRWVDDPELVIAICRPHHVRKRWEYAKGRLLIQALGGGRFACQLMRAPDKFAARVARAGNWSAA